jgi:hypothetical protein
MCILYCIDLCYWIGSDWIDITTNMRLHCPDIYIFNLSSKTRKPLQKKRTKILYPK